MTGFDVYRISKTKWAGKISGSGAAARWNPNGIFICYTAESKALACLEMLAHLQTQQINHLYKITRIFIPSDLHLLSIHAENLSSDWTNFFKMDQTQDIGKNWVLGMESCVLKVPSALIGGSYNFLINPSHPDYSKIQVAGIEDFLFDPRLTKTP